MKLHVICNKWTYASIGQSYCTIINTDLSLIVFMSMITITRTLICIKERQIIFDLFVSQTPYSMHNVLLHLYIDIKETFKTGLEVNTVSSVLLIV